MLRIEKKKGINNINIKGNNRDCYIFYNRNYVIFY